MEISLQTTNLHEIKTPCLVIPVLKGKSLGSIAETLDKKTRGVISKIVALDDIKKKIGANVIINNCPGLKADRLMLVNSGSDKGIDESAYRKILGTVAKELGKLPAISVSSTLDQVTVLNRDNDWKIKQHARILDAELYAFDELKTKNKRKKRLSRLAFVSLDKTIVASTRKSIADAKALILGISLAKDLANRPGNVCTPTHLAETASKLATEHPVLKCKIIEEIDMEKMGMASFLSVSQGSRQPAKLIELKYSQSQVEGQKPIVIVGKGVTFDSGGISLKPGAAMDEMKYDMGGAASVLGTMLTVAKIQPAIDVVALIPATENLPDGNASKPGDIVKSMSGQTIEILNTDAEGRLILCDALTYAAQFNPEVIIDIATLTGACVVALGAHATGLLSNDDQLSLNLTEAGEAAHDRVWRLPLWPDYQKQIESPFADMANVGGKSAGTITAACFLSRFVENQRWAHLDIAGTAWNSGANKGATGRPVALLSQYICSQATTKKYD
jgi:leucyl aminopeptidase